MIATIVCSLGLAMRVPLASAAYTPANGDLIKTATNPAIYYINTEHKRQLYVNAVTFWTWHTGSWSNIKATDNTIKTIKTISQTDFDNLVNGSNVTARPGIKLIKFQNSSNIYTVTVGNKLAPIPDPTTALMMFGSDWNTKVITIQDGFESDYTKDGVLDVTAGLQAYSNTTYGFSLQLPATWKGYITKTEVYSYGTVISFGFSSWSDIFVIGVYNKAQWDKIKSDPDNEIAMRSYLGENNQYYFTGNQSQEVGDAKLTARRAEFDQIIKTFKALSK